MALECAGQVATEDVWGRVLRKRGGGVSRAENAVEALAIGGRSAWTGDRWGAPNAVGRKNVRSFWRQTLSRVIVIALEW